jgi:soluble lytic murein transglycosylase
VFRGSARGAAPGLLAVAWLLLGAEAPEAPARPGLALRAALDARAAGRFDEAIARFAAVERAAPLVGDHAARLGLETRAEAGSPAALLEAAASFAERYPASPLRARVARLRGDAAAAVGEGALARSSWREALAGAADAAERAELLRTLAASEQAAGALDFARADSLAAWNAAPGSAAAASAGDALTALEAAGAVPARSAKEWLERGDALLEAGFPGEAVDAYDRALDLGGDAALREALLRQRAFALFRARRYPEAVAAFERLGEGAEARFWRARAVARSGDLPAAIAAFEALGAGGSGFAHRALLLAATLLEDDAATRERAAAHYAAVAEAASDDALARDARWRLGWLRYRSGAAGEAAEQLGRLAEAEPDPIDALRPRYFALRARERSEAGKGAGGEESLRAAFGALAGEYPLSYYGWRAALRAGGAAPRALPPAEPLGASTLPGPATSRIEILLEAGLAAEADTEIAALAPSARGDADRVALARLAGSAGNPQLATELVAGGRSAELAQGPRPGREEIWRLAWPRAFAQDVEAVAGAEGVAPELVFAIMREESGFRPRALSPVGARGLLQLMPETGARLALELGMEPPAADALYEPALNVRLGTRLLGGLLRDFEGQLPAAIGGYNAGAAVVRRWLASGRGLADDEWVEAIPYDETRAYVRRVLRSLHAYRVLY